MKERKLQDHEKSDFNASLDALERLANLKKMAIKCVIKDDNFLLTKVILAYWMELKCLINMKDQINYEPKYQESRRIYDTMRNKFYSKNQIVYMSKKDIDYLHNFYFDLQQLCQDYELNIRKKEDSSWMMGGK